MNQRKKSFSRKKGKLALGFGLAIAGATISCDGPKGPAGAAGSVGATGATGSGGTSVGSYSAEILDSTAVRFVLENCSGPAQIECSIATMNPTIGSYYSTYTQTCTDWQNEATSFTCLSGENDYVATCVDLTNGGVLTTTDAIVKCGT